MTRVGPDIGEVPAVGSSDGVAMPDGFGVYVHWPFCAAKCPYCDFNSHVRDEIDQQAWADALTAELAHFAAETGGRRVESVFFGGGTPSLMAPAGVATVIEAIDRLWPLAPDVEITLEANPTSVEASRFQGFRSAGINRVSLGVQALIDADLAALGRMHSAAEALAAVEVAGRHFDRFSFDLIYGRPGQTVEAWTDELSTAIARMGDHASAYQLTIEPNTVFAGRFRRGELTMPDDDVQAWLFETTRALLTASGRPAYEISNHARPGQECRHNLVYWRYGDYVGVGPGAHGRLTLADGRFGTRTHRAPEIWLERVQAQGHAEHEREPIAPGDQVAEALMMGLRLTEGVPLARLARCAGVSVSALASTVLNETAVRDLTEGGYLSPSSDRLLATEAGQAVLDSVLSRLLV